MLITKTSLASGAINSREIDISPEDLRRWEAGGILIQDAFPHLSADDREFLMTGITPDEWDEHFSDEDEIVEPFSDKDYDEFGVRHSTSFNQPF